MSNSILKLTLGCIAALALSLGCQDTDNPVTPLSGEAGSRTEEPIGEWTSLNVVLVESTESSVTVAVDYKRHKAQEGPRMMELFLEPSEGLNFATAIEGAAATVAGKQLFSQKKSDGSVRLVLLSQTNLNRLDTGVLVEVTFERSKGSIETVLLKDKQPIFAPEAANAEVRLGGPLEIGAADAESTP